ncbi:hypothetical protein YB2330_000303 [Saitoella coloradoensis]
MIDHLLGRPSTDLKRLQVLLVALSWLFFLRKGHPNGPPLLRHFFRWLSRREVGVSGGRVRRRVTSWHVFCMTMTGMYVLKNLDKLLGLGAPEPLARMYSRSFYRATWLTTALDAGFWTAAKLNPKWLRDIASLIFSAYYLIFADQADEKVRKIRAMITVEHLRVSWEKQLNPYLHAISGLRRPRLRMQTQFTIKRPRGSAYTTPIRVHLYFAGSAAELRNATSLVLNFPGGGFVAMNPQCHEESLVPWASRLGVPIVSVDYGKAPEHPYPWALDECFDTYRALLLTKGRNIGLSGYTKPKIAIIGDSAGGNFAAGVTLRILTSMHEFPGLEMPRGLVLIYPFLDFNISSWMSDEDVRLLRQESGKDVYSKGIMRTKSRFGKGRRGKSVLDMEVEGDRESEMERDEEEEEEEVPVPPKSPVQRKMGTQLAMTSRVSFFNDRIITPEMMRAMAILYLGPRNRPDFTTDYFLSPIVAPSSLLAKFPKTYFMCGEKDPFVDDTVLFAGRIREARRSAWQRRQGLGLGMTTGKEEEMDERQWVEMSLIKGVSHGVLQMVSFLPEARGAVARCRDWLAEILKDDPSPGVGVDGGVPMGRRTSQQVEEGLERRMMRALHGRDAAAGKAGAVEVLNGDGHGAEDDDDDDAPLTFASSRPSPSPALLPTEIASTSPPPLITGSAAVLEDKDKDPRKHHKRGDTWERKNLMQEGDLMSRRRAGLLAGLIFTKREGEEDE